MGAKYKILDAYDLFAAGAKTASFNTDGTAYPENADEVIIYINVTAASGTTPTLDGKYQVSPDKGVTWYDQGTAMTQVTATGSQVLKIANCAGPYARMAFTIGGTTPSFTFSAKISGKRHGA